MFVLSLMDIYLCENAQSSILWKSIVLTWLQVFNRVSEKMWCDLRKPVTWCKIILSYWYHSKVWIILFSELFTWIISDTGYKSYWSSNAIKNKGKKTNIIVMMLISFNLHFTLAPFSTCDRVSQITVYELNRYQKTHLIFLRKNTFSPIWKLKKQQKTKENKNKIKQKQKRSKTKLALRVNTLLLNCKVSYYKLQMALLHIAVILEQQHTHDTQLDKSSQR